MAAAGEKEFLIKILLVYWNVRGQQQRSVTEYVDNMWATADTEELNPKRQRGEKDSAPKL